MSERFVDLTRRGFRAYNESGPAAFIDLLEREKMIHPEFMFHVQEDLPNGGDWPGVEGYTEMTRTWLEVWDDFEIEPHEYIEMGDALLVPITQRAVAHGSGIEVTAEFFYVLLFTDGKLEQVRLYSDRELAEQAAATREAIP